MRVGAAVAVISLVALIGAPARAGAQPAAEAVVVSTRIALPAAANGFGPASPYPLQIPVSGIVNTASLKVRIRGFSHTRPADVGLVLVSPAGVATWLMGDPVSGPASNLDLEFQNDAAPLPATQLVSGRYRPSATFPGDLLPAPAPVAQYGLTLPTPTAAEANGVWLLYAADDFGGESGSIEGVDLIFTMIGTLDNDVRMPDVGTTDYPIAIGGLTGSVAGVTLRLLVSHPDTSQIDISLIGPDGTAVDISSGNGTGSNYGQIVCLVRPPVCTYELVTFTDVATVPITAGANPFLQYAAWRPEQPLRAFTGKAGAAANGTWRVRITDRVAGAVGGLGRAVLEVSDGGPVPRADAYVTPFGTPLSVPAPGVLANDDLQGAPLGRAQLVQAPARGALTLALHGGFTYVPDPGFAGEDRFTYLPSTAEGTGAPAEVVITVADTLVTQPPSRLRVAAIEGRTVTLRWDPPALGPTPTGYLIEGGTAPGATAAAAPLGPVPLFTLPLSVGTYYARVRTVSGSDLSAPSNEIPIHVGVPVLPSAPADVRALVDGDTVSFAWRNTFDGAAPQALELVPQGGLAPALPLPVSEAVTFSGVPPGTYDVAFRALNAGGASALSPTARVTVPGPCAGPPQTPVDLLVYRDGIDVRLAWEAAPGGPAPSGFAIHVAGTVTGVLPLSQRRFSAAAPPGTYVLAVAAVNACGSSALTPPQTVVVP